jgi:hypothetical protein
MGACRVWPVRRDGVPGQCTTAISSVCDGDIYRYFECPISVYEEFLAAESKGRYFSQHIRNRFRDELVYRNAGGSPHESLEQQLNSSVALAKARAQKRAAAQAAGVHE